MARNAAIKRIHTILLADDDFGVLNETADWLETFGYNVIVAKSSETALDFVRAGYKFHLLLTDTFSNADVTGMALSNCAKSLRPGMPVIFMWSTFAEQDELKSKAILLGKPVERFQLKTAIRAALA